MSTLLKLEMEETKELEKVSANQNETCSEVAGRIHRSWVRIYYVTTSTDQSMRASSSLL